MREGGVLGSSLSCEIIAKPTGKIITDVAVLLIHIDKNAVAVMNPKIILLLFTPTWLMMFRAILLCSFHFWIAIAKIKLPINKKTYLCPNAAVVVFISKPPERGKIIIGNKELGTYFPNIRDRIQYTENSETKVARIISINTSRGNNPILHTVIAKPQ